MKLEEAINILNKYAPCPHEDTISDYGKWWAKCLHCEEMFRKQDLHLYQKAAREFEEAMDCIRP